MLLLLCYFLGFSQAHKEKSGPSGSEKDSAVTAATHKDLPPVVTQGTVTIEGKTIAYTATTGFMTMKNENGKPLSHIFYIAYTKNGVEDKADRPITFAYNGGPGSSSVWLHMGMLGPKRVLMSDSGEALPPPARYVNNPYSWLDKTDLVFIDPVTTGFSRPAKGEDATQFHGYEEDLKSVGDFIREYISRQSRWNSPKILAGESYGTTRSAGLSGYLQDNYGMYLNGVILVSSVLNFQTIDFNEGNDLPYILYLPTYAAAAWYHHKIASDLQGSLQKTIAEAKTFAEGPYNVALMKGDQLSAAEVDSIAGELHRLTGLPETYIKRSRLRINAGNFEKELLRPENEILGRYDSRIANSGYDQVGEYPEYDPSYAATLGTFSTAVNDYLERDLKFKNENPYNILTGVGPWPYRSDNRYFTNFQTLRNAMTQNKYLKVWVLCGYFDLATPFDAAEYVFDHMGLEPYQQSRLHMTFYPSGHMIYTNMESLRKAKKDADAFYDSIQSHP
ncbi:MAG: peptidase S10 [Bacteroidota bacterium]|nr:peptidase S10 [Bacteroidota bacterium]